MQVWQTVSSVRQRARNAEIITKRLKEEVKHKLVKCTHDQISTFEEHARVLKEKAAREEVEEEAELIRLSEGWSRARAAQLERQLAATLADNHSESSSIKSGTTNLLRNSRSESTLPSRAYLDRSEVLHAYRPPSPLHLYDYGSITVRPRSQQQQVRNRGGEASRPAYRQEFCGVYFPGPECKQGPYGTSMVDPILMPPRSWVKSQHPPDRYRDTADLRPRTAEGRDRPMKATCAETVLAQHEESKPKEAFIRSTRAQETIIKCRKDAARKKNQEAFIEHVRFEQGQFDGRFANPLSKNSGWTNEEMANEMKKIGEEPLSSLPRMAWDPQSVAEASFGGLTTLAKHIFLSLHSVMRKRRATLKHLFKYVNHGVPGILEPAEFLEGLQRLGIVERGECSPQQMADLMQDLDPNFDGRVILSEVHRCVQATRAICGQKVFKDHLNRGNTTILAPTNLYSESMPVEKVKVEMKPKSLWDFECSFEQLRQQQHELLIIHKEINK
ncbi:unnamed protein product [Durusdinium trenchii]|uniref:EF-hand domain-containing protein n=1 Tax=Durusdinium trenchii TaxID=1381693 RepID=A0ABP0SZH6_9DINO